jgi:DNA helicase II / ATP-dependent DNA helicase PcrA
MMERAGWAALSPALRGSVESAGRDRNVLRVKERDFSVGDLSWGRGGTLGRDTSLYKAMQQVCRSTTEQGFLCYEEMFIWANELLDIYPRIADALRYRFPLLFVDEVQDNSEAQSALLHRTFVDGNSTVIRQRFGDMNQAIFGYAGQEGAASDIFSLSQRCLAYSQQPQVWPADSGFCQSLCSHTTSVGWAWAFGKAGPF